MTNARIRTLAPSEVETLIDWAAAEGWNPGEQDATALRPADPDGFLGAFVDGEMVAGISAIAYGTAFGFIGLYICRPDMRGKGFGKTVWDAGMARLAGRTLGLDGVPEQQANYRAMGFVPAYRTFRYSGTIAAPASGSANVQPVSPGMLPMLEDFDRAFFPAPRAAFLQGWLSAPHIALVCMEGETVLGYGVARRCREGAKIGPLFAAEHATAGMLLSELSLRCDCEIHIDVPETSGSFADTLLRQGMSKGFETMRMYRGPTPALRSDGIFGITTLELG
jgi:GNAT superfamily N-acetyltransferase